MYHLTKRTAVASFILVALIVTGVVLWRTPLGALADIDETGPDPAAIVAVAAHPLTPGPIITERGVKARGGCPASVVSYHSDGFKEYALAVRPTVKAPRSGYPVVIFAHGYTSPANYVTDNTQYAAEVNYYCQHNYLVFKPDYRGIGKSEGQSENGLYSPGDTYDVLNLAASLSAYPGADPNRIGLVGHSMGGAVVLRAAVASHGLPVKAVITLAGAVASLPEMTYHWTGQVPPDVAVKRLQVMRAEGPPSQNAGYWHDASSINYVAGINAPVQIHQGLSDTSVPASFGAHLDQALTAAGKSHEYYTYPNTGHLFASPAPMNLFLGRSTQFLDQHVKA